MGNADFFSGKVIVVTGGSDGIGKALVDALISFGASVATCGRDQKKLDSLHAENTVDRLFTYQADVSIYSDVQSFMQSVLSRFGKIDALINNAGISMRAEMEDVDVEVYKKVMDINFMGAVYCTKLALSSLLSNQGTIVNISSIAGFRGLPGRGGYSASKFAMNGWTESLRTELLYKNVHVLLACPGFTKSNIRNRALNPQAEAQGESPLDEDNLMSAETCADLILKAIIQRKRTLILDAQGKKTIWLNKIFPGLTDKLVYRFFYRDGRLIK
jgi:short-subunit dehydrogenase